MKIGIVGRGMIGSSAARHLAKAGHDVTLIGPGEPENRADHTGVFASHYDEGRITRLLDPDPIWQQLAAASIERYSEIEKESGISFYTAVGHLIGAIEGSDYLTQLRDVQRNAGVDCVEFSGDALREAFPYLTFHQSTILMHQSTDAGHVSPRRLVAAQSKAAVAHGATFIEEAAVSVSGNKVTLANETISFERVLVACGGFSNFVLDRPLKLMPYARTITLFELDETEAQRLAEMPSLIYRGPNEDGPYVLPPIRYPDGKVYLKIGGEPVDKLLTSQDDMAEWFRGTGDPQVGIMHMQTIAELMPELRFHATHWDSCVVTHTETGLPYIGEIGDGLVVAAGGCGGAAKSCDEIGRIAGEAVLGNPDPRFQVVFDG